ncbi:MAG: exodeoxyribonuclease V subunit gamma [Spirochaetaceae bacterium]
MAYTIYHSNNLYEFINKFSPLFHTADLFGETVVTVVQNRNIASWLKLQLTKQDGISMDLHVEYPENAVKNLVLGYEAGQKLFDLDGESKSLLFMDSLKIVVFKTLEELLVDNTKFPNLYNYVQNSSQRLFQLSDSIAGLFYHYGMNCPQMVSSWDKNELYKNVDGLVLRAEDQTWQMALWNRLFSGETNYLHISKVLTSVLESKESYNSQLSPYGKCRVILFGSSFLGESAIKFFNYLSSDIEIHHFILTPSNIYIGEEEVKPVSLLNRFSGLINGFTSISREPDFTKSRINLLINNSNGSLLSQLKQGIKENSLVEQDRPQLLNISDSDNSLRICKVTGGWREIEILKDKILALLDFDSELKLTDIGVVAPEITNYSSYIEGVFPEVELKDDGTPIFGKKHIPYNIMGLKGGEDSPYIRGILSLLDLPGSDFNRKDIFNLISNPCFMQKFNLTNSVRDLFLEQVDALNIKWGIDGKHRVDLGYTNDNFNTWEDGFKRFLLGIALNRGSDVSLPHNVTDSQATDSLGELVHIIRSLYSDLWNLNSLSLNMDEWVYYIETVMETYLQPVKNDLFDERERLSVKHQYRNILNLLDDLKNLSNFKKRNIPYAVFRSLLKEFIVKSGNSRGRYLTGGITFSSLKPLRAVPFKHIFVLGLNEELFPGKEKVPSYDLRGIYDQKIDLSKRQNDKFAFLELLLSAKDSLTLFYNAKNQVTGEELQPSVVINELLEAISINFGNTQFQENVLIENHPLHNFDSKYFSTSSTLKSYNRRAYESANAYGGQKNIAEPIDLYDLGENTDDIEIDIKDLIQFVKNPVKSFFTKSEGLYIDESESKEEDVFENRDLGFITKWKLATMVLEYGLENSIDLEPLSDSFFNTAKIEGAFKDDNLTTNIREEVNDLIKGVDNFLTDNGLKGTSFVRENRELKAEYKPIIFDIEGKKVSIIGELENLWINDNRECFTTGISLGSGKEMKPKDKITPYIYSLIMYSHENMLEEKITAYSIGKEVIAPTEFVRNDKAKENLRSLVELYIQNSQKPIPIFPDIMEDPDSESLSKAWEKSADNSMFYSLIAECPYVKMAYGDQIPEFETEDIDKIYSALYSEIIVKKAKK